MTTKNYQCNPLLDSDKFIPDVEAHVWDDGKIYLYGSTDIKGNTDYCSGEYHVFSSCDMVNWTDHGVVFSVKDISWDKNQTTLYAPDCAYKNGNYYLYYCVPDGRCGVAISDFPYGPFKDVGLIKGVLGIDPAVFTDDDGQAYIYWGQFDSVRVAKLKDNMVEIEPDTITQPLSVAEHEFHEGSSVKKIQGKYYYLFTDTHRHNKKATCLGYAVSNNPMTDFTYKGVVIDNFGCDPETWNNHGSIECFKGKWYVFYHRSTHASKFSRQVCAEPITFNTDGTINEVEMTSSGTSGSISANTILAYSACKISGNARIEGDTLSKQDLVLNKITSGDTADYKYIEFDGQNKVEFSTKSSHDMRIEIYVDGKYYSNANVQKSDEFIKTVSPIDAIYGIHSITLKFFAIQTYDTRFPLDNAALDEFKFLK